MTGYINFGIGGGNNALAQFAYGMDLGERIKEGRERKEYRTALGVLAQDPENADALAAVFQRDPRTGIALMNRADEKAFGRDAAAMYEPQGQPNALLGLGGGGTPSAAPQNAIGNALAGPLSLPLVSQNASFEDAFAPVVDGETAAPLQDGQASIDMGAITRTVGKPQSEADMAFLRMLRRDPVKALEMRGQLRDNFIGQMKAESEFYGFAMGQLGRATDAQSWNAAMQSVMPRAQALGMDLSSIIPTQYPGPEAVNELMQRAIPVKERIDYMLREANVEADNARADRNTDSLIETREGRLKEYERHNRASESNQRRGQNLSASRQRSRERSGGNRKAGGARETLPTVASPAEAMKLPSGTKFRTPDGQIKVRP